MQYIYGKNAVIETIGSERKVYRVLISRDFNDNNLISLIKSKGILLELVEKKKIEDIAKGNHQGILAEVENYKYCSLDDILNNSKNDKPFIVILDHLEDPHNLGAIIRTCEAASVDGIIIPKDRSVQVNSTVMKVSSGALNNVSICQVTNLNNTIKVLKEKGIWIVGTDMEDSVDYKEVDYKLPIALITGGEGNGISRLVRESCDFVVNIPMKGKINSLNASVATAIMIYEVLRQRGK